MSQVSRQTSPDYYEKLPARLSKLKTEADNYQSINNELRKPDADPDDLWYAMGSRLQKILRYRYYREGGYRSFSDYCARGLGYSRQHTYKLMKVVQYIDTRCRQDANQAESALTEQLTSLGFTKIYLLHSLPPETLNRLLSEGLTDRNGSTVRLEHASIAQIRRLLVPPQESSQKQPAHILLNMIKSHTGALQKLAAECHEQAEHEAIVDCLQTIGRVAQSVLECAQALSTLPDSNANAR
jgi:hypothetical protein